jgi:carbon-monoxide dehydrogenase medium subunit
VQIRNRATLGGNLAHGSPAADLVTPLLVLDAFVVVAHGLGRRKTGLAEYLAPARERLGAPSLLVEVRIPEPPHGARRGWAFQKFGRTEADISVVNVAAGLQLDVRGRVKWARLALGAVAEFPFRMFGVEKLMTGRELDHTLLAEAGEQVMREVKPITDQRASAEFRRELSRVIAGRAWEECADQAGHAL